MKYFKLLLLFTICLSFSACDEDQAEIDKDLIKQYIADNNLDATETSSGLFVIIDEPGTGGHPNLLSTVTVHYKGTYLNGTIFDSTEGKDPVQFSLMGVIPGWQEGIPYFQKGGKGMLLIPSALAYGNGSHPLANEVLVFEIELIDFQ